MASSPYTKPVNPLDQYFSAPASTPSTPRLVLSVDGLDKGGKTHFSIMTTPTPCRVISFDTGTETIVKKARAAGRDVKLAELSFRAPDPNKTKKRDIDKDLQAEAKAEWEKAKDILEAFWQDRSVRTVVIDTGDALWDLCLLSHLGKLQKIVQRDRGEPNADFSKVLWDLYKQRPDLNIILIHKQRKQYVGHGDDANWNGKYERKGWNQIGFYVDLSLVAAWDSILRQHYIEMDVAQPSRFGGQHCGTRWYGADNSFSALGMTIFPETELTPEVWGL